MAMNIELTLDDVRDVLGDLTEPWLHEALDIHAPTPTPKSCCSSKAIASERGAAVVLGIVPGGPPVIGSVLGYLPQKEKEDLTGRCLKRRAPAESMGEDSTRKVLRWGGDAADVAQCSAEQKLEPSLTSISPSLKSRFAIEIATGVPVEEEEEEENVPPPSVENAKDLSRTVDMRAVYDEVKDTINMSFEEYMEMYYSGF